MTTPDLIRLSTYEHTEAPHAKCITPSVFLTQADDGIDVRMNLPVFFAKLDLVRTATGEVFQIWRVGKEVVEVQPIRPDGADKSRTPRVWIKAGLRHLVRVERCEHLTDRDTCVMYDQTMAPCYKSTMHTSRAFRGLDPTEIVNEDDIDLLTQRSMCQAALDAAWALARAAEARGESLGYHAQRIACARQYLDDCRTDAPGYRGK